MTAPKTVLIELDAEQVADIAEMLEYAAEYFHIQKTSALQGKTLSPMFQYWEKREKAAVAWQGIMAVEKSILEG